MEQNFKYQHLKFLIERFDHYYETINNKAAFMIALNTFLLSGVGITYSQYKKEIITVPAVVIVMIILAVCCIGSMIFTVMALRPYTKDNYANDDINSLIFYGGIAKHTANFLVEKFKLETEETIFDDMQRQVHSLAKGLNEKFYFINLASILVMIPFALAVLIFFLMIKIL